MVDVEMLFKIIKEARTPSLGVLAVYDHGYEIGYARGVENGMTQERKEWLRTRQ
jgi:hypothetical protein